MKQIIAKSKIIKSQRQAPNLKNILTSAKFSKKDNNYGSKKCGDPRCGTCPHFVETDQVNFNNSPDTFKIKGNLSCKSEYVLYVITCVNCKKQYIGKTNKLSRRVTVHKQHIRDPKVRMLGVSAHLDSCNKNNQTKFKITPFYKQSNNCDIKLCIMEQHFIDKFKPELNGLQLKNID